MKNLINNMTYYFVGWTVFEQFWSLEKRCPKRLDTGVQMMYQNCEETANLSKSSSIESKFDDRLSRRKLRVRVSSIPQKPFWSNPGRLFLCRIPSVEPASYSLNKYHINTCALVAPKGACAVYMCQNMCQFCTINNNKRRTK